MHLGRNIEARSCNHYRSGKVRSITYSECVFVALVIQHAKLKRRYILTSVACPTVQYFSALSRKRHYFWKKKNIIEHKKYVLCFVDRAAAIISV